MGAGRVLVCANHCAQCSLVAGSRSHDGLFRHSVQSSKHLKVQGQPKGQEGHGKAECEVRRRALDTERATFTHIMIQENCI